MANPKHEYMNKQCNTIQLCYPHKGKNAFCFNWHTQKQNNHITHNHQDTIKTYYKAPICKYLELCKECASFKWEEYTRGLELSDYTL